MEKPCVETGTKMENRCTLFLHEAKKTVSAWDRKQSWKKAMKLK